jgi:hypothetical protein
MKPVTLISWSYITLYEKNHEQTNDISIFALAQVDSDGSSVMDRFPNVAFLMLLLRIYEIDSIFCIGKLLLI